MTLRWVDVAAAEGPAEGEAIGVELEGLAVAIYRVDGAYYATDDLCSHGRAKLSEGYLEGCFIECPLHAGRFDVRTGAADAPPVTRPVRAIPVQVVSGGLRVGLPAGEPGGDQ